MYGINRFISFLFCLNFYEVRKVLENKIMFKAFRKGFLKDKVKSYSSI